MHRPLLLDWYVEKEHNDDLNGKGIIGASTGQIVQDFMTSARRAHNMNCSCNRLLFWRLPFRVTGFTVETLP